MFIGSKHYVTRLKNCCELLAIQPRDLVRTMGIAAIAFALTACAAGDAQERPLNAQQRPVNAQGAAIKGFLDRVNDYIALQKKEDDGLPKLQPREDTSKTEVHQRALAARIRLAREHASPGDLFRDAAPLIREIVLQDAQSRAPQEKKAQMEEVPRKDPLKVNAEYPEKAALATVPPLLLEQLPRLPEGLEYRFMGRDLILRDTKANLIADFINEAVPIVKR
jgi:hypothetical protein